LKYHEPVMPAECMEGLRIIADGTYADATFGGGGHSSEILKRLGPKGKLIAFDQDADAGRNNLNDERFTLIEDNFKNMKEHLIRTGMTPLNGILADLGVSSHQFDVAERGFSIRYEHDLDMRMDRRSGITALHVLNTYPEKELTRIFSNYGEIKNSKTLAAAIVNNRNNHLLQNSSDLIKVIGPLVPKAAATQYMAQVYQALRIEVNNELSALKELLYQSSEVLAPGGRLVILSYHSLEDRLVKNFINKGNFEGEDIKDLYGHSVGKLFKPLTKKPSIPSGEEIKRNPRSRSARLRIAEKL
jgi:16S rRNA (cytosine1402-N4)-methyltransferase